MDLRQTFVIDASWDKDEPNMFWGQKVEGQGHIIAAEASGTWCCCWVQPSNIDIKLVSGLKVILCC